MPLFKIPKNTSDKIWTSHSVAKMKQYGLSEQRVRRVLNAPQRREEGIAPNTVAVMQTANPMAKKKTEIWVMLQFIKNREKNEEMGNDSLALKFSPTKMRIISVWRYPGISPINQLPEIPDDVWEVLNDDEEVVYTD